MAGGDGAELQLLGAWSSPFVVRVRFALGLKGLRYEYTEQDLANKSELLLKLNPVHKKVPVLIHHGRRVCESLVVLQYIDEAWARSGPPILPSDPYERARARFWAAYVEEKFYPSWRALFKSTTEEARAEAFKNTIPQVETLEEAFRECSKGKAFFGGEAVGYVDLVLGSYLHWIKVVNEVAGTNLLDEASSPLLAAWAERFSAVNAVEEAMPDAGKVMEYYKTLLARWDAAAAASASN